MSNHKPNVVLLMILFGMGVWLLNTAEIFGWWCAGTGPAANLISEGFETGQTPPLLINTWLRFHESELCQDIETVFVFHRNGMEIWCLVEDEKGYQKLADLVAPLRASFQMDLYVTRPPALKKQFDDKDPPPSLWNNAALIDFLNVPFSGSSPGLMTPRPDDEKLREHGLKQRLLMYADQVQEWSRKLKRYGMDLPGLARAGFETGCAPDLKKRAADVCLSHVQALDKLAARLTDSLTQALPRHVKRADVASKPPKSATKSTPVEIALRLSTSSRSVSRRIYGFLYPQHHTVELTDLREPGLLESLRTLHELVSDFQKAAAERR